ncbi:MAG: molybdenum cofactor biosynthesis protein MoaE [Phycisphaerales bacterium]|nr:molybdenum cofactor biosynthesis protein MoaE [Phycisphaerales bacterium]
MSVQIRLTQGPLATWPDTPYAQGSGARIVFDGVVRPTEDGEKIQGLHYEAYRPMAEQQLEIIGQELLETHGLIAMDIEHSIGLVPNYKCSFRLVIDSKHRKEGLAAMDEFINRLKQDVPIWKSAK